MRPWWSVLAVLAAIVVGCVWSVLHGPYHAPPGCWYDTAMHTTLSCYPA